MTVYLDHAASAPLRAEARDAWLEASEAMGNASSIHAPGQQARRLLEDARERLASALDCDPVEIVFTSGGTESVNLGITGLWRAHRAPGVSRVVAPLAEHHATLDTIEWLAEAEGAPVTWVSVDTDARLVVEDWQRALEGDDAAVAALLAANNEVGTVQPVAEAVRLAADARVPLHLDAVGAVGRIPLSFRALRTDTGSTDTGLVAMSVASHKVGGPVGTGALVVAREARLQAILHGGGHQRGLRAGTQDVPGAVAFAVAAELAVAEQAAVAEHVAALRDRLERGIRALIPEAIVSAEHAERLPGHLNVVFPGAQGDSMLLLLDIAGIAISTGSACQAGIAEPSHVLLAMGRSGDAAQSALRFTLGSTTTADEIDHVLAHVPASYARARQAGMSSRPVQ